MCLVLDSNWEIKICISHPTVFIFKFYSNHFIDNFEEIVVWTVVHDGSTFPTLCLVYTEIMWFSPDYGELCFVLLRHRYEILQIFKTRRASSTKAEQHLKASGYK